MTGYQHTLSWWWIHAGILRPWADTHDWCLRDPVYLQGWVISEHDRAQHILLWHCHTHEILLWKYLNYTNCVKIEQYTIHSPLSPPPKDHTVRPSWATAMVWELPQATCPTPLISFTSVGMFRLWLSLWPGHRTSEVVAMLPEEWHHFEVAETRSSNLKNKLCTKSAKVPFAPCIKLSIISHSSTVSVASRHTNNNLCKK